MFFTLAIILISISLIIFIENKSSSTSDVYSLSTLEKARNKANSKSAIDTNSPDCDKNHLCASKKYIEYAGILCNQKLEEKNHVDRTTRHEV